MMARRCLLLTVALGLFAAGPAVADMTYTIPDSPFVLQHEYWYSWAIDWTLPDSAQIQEATLTITLIDEVESDGLNMLYIHLLDDAVTATGIDDATGQEYGDYFESEAYTGGSHRLIGVYSDLAPGQPETLVFKFDQDLLADLRAFASDGRVGIGMDPDCVFVGGTIELDGSVVPAPGAAALAGIGLLAVGWWRRQLNARQLP